MRIAILGCGYVGCALAERLVPDHAVIGVRRSSLEAVRATGAQAVRADVTDPAALSAVPSVDAVVFTASSGGRDAAAARRTYVEGLRTVVDSFADRETPPESLLYTSSTGVYGDHDGAWVDEDTPPAPETARAEALRAAEEVATDYAETQGITGTVARLAGLYGPDRYRLNRYLSGTVEPGYLNLIHRDDAAGAVAHLLPTLPATDLVLVVDDEPVDRVRLSRWLADQVGTTPPAVAGGVRAGRRGAKRCANGRLHRLGYELSYPTFREGYRAAIAASG